MVAVNLMLLSLVVLAPVKDPVPDVTLDLPICFQMAVGDDLRLALEGVSATWLVEHLAALEVTAVAEPAVEGRPTPSGSAATLPDPVRLFGTAAAPVVARGTTSSVSPPRAVDLVAVPMPVVPLPLSMEWRIGLLLEETFRGSATGPARPESEADGGP